MKKVCFLTNNINQCGGIERLISTLSICFSEDKEFELTILSLYSREGSISYFPFHKGTKCIHAGCSLSSKPDSFLVGFFSENKFDDLVTFHSGISLIISRILRKIRPINWIATEHCDPMNYTWKRRLLNLYVYHQADCLVLLTNKFAEYYRKKFIKNTVVINNPVSFKSEKSHQMLPQILAVGRIETVKRFDMLVKAFESIENKYPDWRLCIVGGGSEYEHLKQQADKCSHIILAGQQTNVKDYMMDSSFLVISSQYEGFSIVAIEALECGLPLISTNLPSIRSITEGYNCCIFTDQDDWKNLSEKIEQLICNPVLLREMSLEAKKCAKKFYPNEVFKYWKKIL